MTFIDLHMLPALHSRNEVDLIMVGKCFDALLDSFCQNFIEDFCINVHQRYWPEILFFVVVMTLSGFAIWPHKS